MQELKFHLKIFKYLYFFLSISFCRLKVLEEEYKDGDVTEKVSDSWIESVLLT